MRKGIIVIVKTFSCTSWSYGCIFKPNINSIPAMFIEVSAASSVFPGVFVPPLWVKYLP
jgi:hypothetical protein